MVTLLAGLSAAHAQSEAILSGHEIMQEVYQRHEQFPYIYEEQVMVLIDAAGNRDTRKLRRYSRLDTAETGHYLLLFDDPPEVRGVGLLTTIEPQGDTLANIYLPAYGQKLIESIGQNESDSFLGTDFSVNDLVPESLDKHHFERQQDERIGKIDYFVLNVFNKQQDINSAPVTKRHFIRKDNYYITRTDTFDQHGRLHKRQTHHDLKPLGGNMWRADMILMDDVKARHKTLLKIVRRIFSRDYVPEGLFTLKWLVENQRIPVVKKIPTTETTDNLSETTASTTTETNH